MRMLFPLSLLGFLAPMIPILCFIFFMCCKRVVPPEVDDPAEEARSAHETELARVRAEADARAAANAEELERLRAEKARVDAEAELARVRARGDA